LNLLSKYSLQGINGILEKKVSYKCKKINEKRFSGMLKKKLLLFQAKRIITEQLMKINGNVE